MYEVRLRSTLLAVMGLSLGACGGDGGGSDPVVAPSRTASTAGGSLTNGVPVALESGPTGTLRRFTLDVPAGATYAHLESYGGIGDVALHVSLGEPPSTADSDAGSDGADTFERVANEFSPEPGRYHLLVEYKSAVTGPLYVEGRYEPGTFATPVTEIDNNIAVVSLHGGTRSVRRFAIDVPAGASDVRITTSGGDGDVSLLVSQGSVSGVGNADCASASSDNEEVCEFPGPQNGRFEIVLYGESAYADVELLAIYSVPPPASLTLTCTPAYQIRTVDELAIDPVMQTGPVGNPFHAWIDSETGEGVVTSDTLTLSRLSFDASSPLELRNLKASVSNGQGIMAWSRVDDSDPLLLEPQVVESYYSNVSNGMAGTPELLQGSEWLDNGIPKECTVIPEAVAPMTVVFNNCYVGSTGLGYRLSAVALGSDTQYIDSQEYSRVGLFPGEQTGVKVVRGPSTSVVVWARRTDSLEEPDKPDVLTSSAYFDGVDSWLPHSIPSGVLDGFVEFEEQVPFDHVSLIPMPGIFQAALLFTEPVGEGMDAVGVTYYTSEWTLPENISGPVDLAPSAAAQGKPTIAQSGGNVMVTWTELGGEPAFTVQETPQHPWSEVAPIYPDTVAYSRKIQYGRVLGAGAGRFIFVGTLEDGSYAVSLYDPEEGIWTDGIEITSLDVVDDVVSSGAFVNLLGYQADVGGTYGSNCRVQEQ